MFLTGLHEVFLFKSKGFDFELMHSDAFSYYPIEGRISPFVVVMLCSEWPTIVLLLLFLQYSLRTVVHIYAYRI